MEARFSAPVQTGPVAHPASCAMGTGSFPGVKSGRGVMLTPHALLVPWSRNSRDIPLLPLWVVRPVQNLSVCTTVHYLLVPWSRNSTAIPLLPLWAVRPVQSLSACTTVHFTFTLPYIFDSTHWTYTNFYLRRTFRKSECWACRGVSVGDMIFWVLILRRSQKLK